VDAFDSPVSRPSDDDTEAAYRALVIGTRDYVRKCGFCKVLVALSGGIDSALVAAIATGCAWAENVLGIGMPVRTRHRDRSTIVAAGAESWHRFEVIG